LRVLLDTATFWWFASGSRQLSRRAAEVCSDPANELLLSPVSVWELLVKRQIGKLESTAPIHEVLRRSREQRLIESLPLTDSAVLRLQSLPMLHRDPFDRMLICQAIDESAVLLTPDAQVRAYPVSTQWE